MMYVTLKKQLFWEQEDETFSILMGAELSLLS